MTLRTTKPLLVFAVAVFYSLLVLNNTTDYDSNFQFVRHVMIMDSTFPGNRGMWRALNQPAICFVIVFPFGAVVRSRSAKISSCPCSAHPAEALAELLCEKSRLLESGEVVALL
jgi:hypothetical protein